MRPRLAILGLGLLGLLAASDAVRGQAVPDAPPTAQRIEAQTLGSRAAARGALGRQQVEALKATLASAGALLLAWGALRPRAGTAERERRLRDGLLLALGLAAGLAWWNFGRFHFPHYVHRSDTYHYYVGAKYFRELGYTRLYECNAVADLEAGLGQQVSSRRVRNLETNRLESTAAIVANPQRCKAHFSDERWGAFRSDAAWFRRHLSPRGWARVQTDHGYNATPVWGLVGGTLANAGAASERQILGLALLDPALLLLMWGAVAWAFGWRVACVGLLFWGTNYPAQFGWNGGSYLRQGWLVTCVVGLCLLRRERPTAAGFFLAWSALLRLFPALLLVPLAFQALSGMWRARRFTLSAAHRRVALGAMLALATLVPLSAATSGGLGVWIDFARNSRVHLGTPLRNHMGLKTLVAYQYATRSEVTQNLALDDPYVEWKAARQESFERRAPLFYALVLGYLVLLARAAGDEEDWAAATLGIGLVLIAAELTSYYSALLLGYAFLWPRRPWIGVALCALAAGSWAFVELFHWYDEIFTWTSAAGAALAVFATALFAWGEREPARGSAEKSL